MADWSASFVPYLLEGQHSHAVTDNLGTDIMGTADKELYNVNLTLLMLISMVMKVVQDLAPDLVTDALLAHRLAIALDTGPNGDRSGWPGWVVLQVKPEDLAIYGATITDSVDALRAKIDAYNHPA